MLSLKRSTRNGQPASADPKRIASRLLPMLFEAMEERDRIVVLDVGSGSQSTIEFFSNYNARLHFVDLFSSRLPEHSDEEVDKELKVTEACASFTEHLALPDDVVFDICLFWDLLHRFDLTTLQGLSRALAPHVDDQTLGYGFGTLHAKDLGDFRYGIHDETHLSMRPVQRETPFHGHTQQQLGEHFTCMAIQRATLLQEGRLELLLARE